MYRMQAICMHAHPSARIYMRPGECSIVISMRQCHEGTFQTDPPNNFLFDAAGNMLARFTDSPERS